jgi:hypothetical protein
VTDRSDFRNAAVRVLDPEDVEGVLRSRFYATDAPRPSPSVSSEQKPTHYKVICISMYTNDLRRLDEMVDSLKARGLTKANRSALIRYALSAVDLDQVPRGL